MFNIKSIEKKKVIVKVKKLVDNAVIPQFKTEGAGACDLVISNIKYSGDIVLVYYGFATEIPVGYKAMIQPRSSFSDKNWVMTNSPGIIDSDYRGEWLSKFTYIPEIISTNLHTSGSTLNVSAQIIRPQFPYIIGDRVTQMYLAVNIPTEFEEVLELSETKRGEGAFGSTN